MTRGFFHVPRVTGERGLYADDRNGGYIFANFLKKFAEHTGRPMTALAKKMPDTAINEMVTNFGMVVVMKDHDGNKICFSTSYRPKLPQAFVERIRSDLNLMPTDVILWADNVFDEPQEAPAREVIYGERPEKPPKQPGRAQIAKKWQHPEALSPDEMSFLVGKSTKPPKP